MKNTSEQLKLTIDRPEYKRGEFASQRFPTNTYKHNHKQMSKKKRTLVLNLTIETGLSGSCCQLTTRNKRLAKKRKRERKESSYAIALNRKCTHRHTAENKRWHTQKKEEKKARADLRFQTTRIE